MKRWLRRARGAVLVGLTWAIVWGVGGGGLMELVVDPYGRIADIWPMVLGIPGFIGGVLFAAIFAVAERRRRFDELSLARFGALGAAVGALLGILGVGLFGIGPLLIVPLTLLGGLSASGSLALARRGVDRERIPAGDTKELER